MGYKKDCPDQARRRRLILMEQSFSIEVFIEQESSKPTDYNIHT